MVPTNYVNFGKDDLPGQVSRKILDVRNQVAIWRCCIVEPAEITTRAPPTAGLRHDVEGRRLWTVRAVGDAKTHHVLKLRLCDGVLFRVEALSPGVNWRSGGGDVVFHIVLSGG